LLEVAGSVGGLGAPLVHRSYRGVAGFLARADRYSTLAAEAWIRSGRPARLSDLVWRPPGRFLGMYVARAGFLDGWRGFLLASLYAYYVFIRSAKVWERARDGWRDRESACCRGCGRAGKSTWGTTSGRSTTG